jgi:5-methylcytosine-specific restriction enzyme subunit McrC
LSYTIKHITVFEHQKLVLNKLYGNVKFTTEHYTALQNYYGQQGTPFFSLINNGVQFNEHVGVIQIGNLVIEVLPKADNQAEDNTKSHWRDILVGMLRAVLGFEIKSTSSSNLKIKPNTILDLYFEIFINEVEYLLHNGLAKQYRKKEGNLNSLKGSLLFVKHLQQNFIHKEKFYTRYSSYDTQHKLHCILYKTILLLKRINTNLFLNSRIGTLLLNFPEMPDIKITQNTLDRITFTRKTRSYEKSINIAKMILLRYHPDLISGRHHVLALMFDMNKLWEKFVYISLVKHKEPFVAVKEQTPAYFWKRGKQRATKFRADIIIKGKGYKDNIVVLDTKWKNCNGKNPSADDLRQMFAYYHYYKADKTALVYPGIGKSFTDSSFLDPETRENTSHICGVIFLNVKKNVKEWQRYIHDEIVNQLF